MDAAAEIGRNPASKHQPIRFSTSVENEQANAGRDGRTRLARPISQARKGTGKYSFPLCSADHEQNWQSYPVDPYSAACDMAIHTTTPEQSCLLGEASGPLAHCNNRFGLSRRVLGRYN